MDDPKKLEEGFGNGTDHQAGKQEVYSGNGHSAHQNGSAVEISPNGVENGTKDHPDQAQKAKEFMTQVKPPMEEQQPVVTKPKTKRIATLDAFRGFTVVIMILVNDAGGAYPRFSHSPWNGCTLGDFVKPFFLFIVGVAIALALKRVPKTSDAVRRIVRRTLKLLFWGILIEGGYFHAPTDLVYGVDMKKIRWTGILQRIALVYMIVALIETFTFKVRPTSIKPGFFPIFSAYKWQWLAGFISFLIYMITTFTLFVPDWSFIGKDDNGVQQKYTVKCGMRGHLGPACNAAGYIDRQVLGINHLFTQPFLAHLKVCTRSSPGAGPFREDAPSWCRAPFDPEGVLSSISSILTGTIGIHYGHVLVQYQGHAERLKHWVSMGFGLIILAFFLHFTDAIPMNKQLYSFSYVCFTAGAAGIVFSGLYIVIDVWGIKKPFLFLKWIGMNAMLVFVMAAQGIFPTLMNGWYYEKPNRNLVNWIQQHLFIDVWGSERVGTLLYVIFVEIVFWSVVAGVLHKKRMYWKL